MLLNITTSRGSHSPTLHGLLQFCYADASRRDIDSNRTPPIASIVITCNTLKDSHCTVGIFVWDTEYVYYRANIQTDMQCIPIFKRDLQLFQDWFLFLMMIYRLS